MKKRPNPPRTARALLSRLLPASYRDAVLGDLDEEFRRRAKGRVKTIRATVWYWRQTLHPDVVRLR
ncbi:MAG: permease prefix domain 2-containing transporter, partial [Gemmatimonadota bacterium]|nr:permease prefix domain 2-containing transporter [Gemmatimonadota bacterium]